jgi:hypothetical protein
LPSRSPSYAGCDRYPREGQSCVIPRSTPSSDIGEVDIDHFGLSLLPLSCLGRMRNRNRPIRTPARHARLMAAQYTPVSLTSRTDLNSSPRDSRGTWPVPRLSKRANASRYSAIESVNTHRDRTKRQRHAEAMGKRRLVGGKDGQSRRELATTDLRCCSRTEEGSVVFKFQQGGRPHLSERNGHGLTMVYQEMKRVVNSKAGRL